MSDVDCVGLYVDVENLMDLAKEAITSTFEQWPEGLPRPCMLRLYAKADQVDLWRVWAIHQFPQLDIHVAGVQHYSLRASKNSADIALALDVMADLLKGRTTYAAVLSDDSDFASLFGKITNEIPRLENGKAPFMWFMTDRIDTRSSILDEFLPAYYMRTVACAEKKTSSAHRKAQSPAENTPTQETSLAEMIIRHIPVGSFKSTDCIKLMKQHSSGHPLAKLDHAKFGTQFVKTIWPALEQYGVRVANPGKKPRRYEMTEEAKRRVGVAP